MSSNAYAAWIAGFLVLAAHSNLTVPIMALRAAFPDPQAVHRLGHRYSPCPQIGTFLLNISSAVSLTSLQRVLRSMVWI